MVAAGSKIKFMGFISKSYALTFLATGLFFSSNFYFVPILPTYLSGIGCNRSEIGVVIGVFSITSIFLRPFFGRVSDSFSKKKLMIFGLAVFAAVPLLYPHAESVFVLALIRFLHGMGVATYATASIVMIADIAPKEKLGYAVGIYVTSISISMGIGPAAGFKLMNHFNFGELMFFPSAASLMALFLILRVSEPVLERVESNKRTFREVLADGHVFLPSLAFASCSTTLGAIMAFLPLYVLGFENAGASLFFLIFAATIVIIRFVAGGLSDVVGRVKVILPSMLFIFSGPAGLAMAEGHRMLYLVALFYGVGYGLAYPSLNAFVVDHTPLENRGTALGIFSASVDTGSFLGPIIAGFLSDHFGFREMFWSVSLFPLGGLVLFALAVTGAKERARKFFS